MEISQTENFFTTNESSLYLLLQTLHSSGISLGPYTHAFGDLRQKYSYLLSQVVQSSIWKASPEEYSPVTISLLTSQTSKPGKAVCVSETTQTTTENRNEGDLPQREEDESGMFDLPDSDQEGSGHEKDNGQLDDHPKETREDDVDQTSSSNTFKRKKRRIKKICGLQKSKRKARQAAKLKLSGKETKRRRESSRKPKPVVFENFDDGAELEKPEEDEEQEEMLEELEGEDDQNDPDFSMEDKAAAEAGDDDGLEDEDGDLDVPEQSDSKPEPIVALRRSVRKRGRPKKGTEVIKPRCDQCAYVGKSENALLNHKMKIHCDTTINFKCTDCQFECTWNKQFYAHMKEHYGEPPYQCTYEDCVQTFDRIPTFLQHRSRHTDDRPYACDLCPLRFRARSNLFAHKKCHSRVKSFECEVCHKCFATKNTLEQHMVTHSDDRPYLCDLCGFATKYQSHLIAHRRIHSGDVYHCHFPQCTYVTPKRSQLKAHMRSHLGIRKHVCSTCGKAFVEKSHLLRHEKIHLLDKPYKCSQCDYTSARADKLKDHMLRHHGAKPPVKRRHPSAQRPRKAKQTPWPPTQVALPHPPLPDNSDQEQMAKQNPNPFVLSEHGYVRMAPPPEEIDNRAMQQTQSSLQVRHSTAVLEIPTQLVSSQQAVVSQNTQSLQVMTSASNGLSGQGEITHAPQAVQMIPNMHNMDSQTVSYSIPTTASTVIVAPHNQQHQQHEHHQQQHHQQQQQQQQQPDYGGLGAFMALF